MIDLIAKANKLDAQGKFAEADALDQKIQAIAQPPAGSTKSYSGEVQDFDWVQETLDQYLREIYGSVSAMWNTPNYKKLQMTAQVLGDTSNKLRQISTQASKELDGLVKAAASPYDAMPTTPLTPTTPMTQTPSTVANPAHIQANRQAMANALTLLQNSLSQAPAGMPTVLSQLINQMKQFLAIR